MNIFERGVIIKRVVKIKKFLLVSLLLFIGISRVSANESYDYTYTGVFNWGSNVEEANTAIINLTDAEGNVFYTYCIDHDTSIISEHNYSIVNIEDSDYIDEDKADLIRNIVTNAYPFSSLEDIQIISKISDLTEEEAIAGAQAAIWHYANGYDFELSDNIKLLYDFYLSLDKNDSFSSGISSLEIVVDTYFEEGVRTTLIKFENENVFDIKYSFNKDLVLEYGVTLEEVESGILLKNLPATASFEIMVSAKQEINKNVYFFYPEGGITASQSLVGVSSGVINVSTKKSITIEDSYYKVIVNKTDSVTGKGISGVTFQIANTSDFSNYVIEEVSNSEGIIVFEKIPRGTWYIREVDVPKGYLPNYEVTKIEVSDMDVNVNITNNPYGEILIIKKDEFGNRLAGVCFDLYKEIVNDDNLIRKDIVTDDKGEVVIENLDEGKYILVETSTKEGYLLSNEDVVVEVDYGKTSEIEIVNESIGMGTLVIKKLDSENNQLLEGAIIGIYKDEDCQELLMEVTTFADDVIMVDLPAGKYWVREIESPEGYLLNLDSYFVDVVKDEVSFIDISNHRIYKTGLNSYLTLVIGGVLFSLFSILYLRYNLWKNKQ